MLAALTIAMHGTTTCFLMLSASRARRTTKPHQSGAIGSYRWFTVILTKLVRSIHLLTVWAMNERAPILRTLCSGASGLCNANSSAVSAFCGCTLPHTGCERRGLVPFIHFLSPRLTRVLGKRGKRSRNGANRLRCKHHRFLQTGPKTF